MRGWRSACFPMSAMWCVNARHADINKRRVRWHNLLSVLNKTKSHHYGWSASPSPCHTLLFFSLLQLCVTIFHVHLLLFFFGEDVEFLWVTTVHMINAGPTLKWLHPAAPVQSPPTAAFLCSMGKRDMELRASGFMLPEASPSAPSQKTPLFPRSERGGRWGGC